MSNQALPRDEAVCADCGQVLEEDLPHICHGAPKKAAFDSTLGPGDHPTIPGEMSDAGVVDPAHELIGKIIGERYEIQCVLGQGGMGVVYHARHISLEKLLAVKLLLIAQNEEYQRRFLQEAQLASQINHPNTCLLYTSLGQTPRTGLSLVPLFGSDPTHWTLAGPFLWVGPYAGVIG